jgi:hypothetical protein
MLCTDGLVHAGRAPLRRLTRFEYDNTIQDIFNDSTNPANALPAEELGNGFGNDADALSVSSLLAEEYGTVAEGIASRATATPAQMATLLHPCAMNVTTATETTCARSIINALGPKLWRRALTTADGDGLAMLESTLRATSGATFPIAIAGVISAMLQSPEFLYRVEFGVPDSAQPTLKRPSGDEMATRLSYLFWGTTPDATLQAAAKTGELLTAQGVLAHATRMLNDPKALPMEHYFFDMLLPINGLTDLERDATQFPNFNAMIGSLMHQETQAFLDYELFGGGSGTWRGALTAPYTFLNSQLASFYGMTGVSGTTFVKTNLDTTQRLGFITQGAVMAGTTPSNNTNPVRRGSFIVQKLMCNTIPLPSGDILAMVKPPDPYSAPTGRERYTLHRSQPVCATCHSQMDPVGFTLENYDPVGVWRDKENNVTIDASGSLPSTGQAVKNGIELIQALAATSDSQYCFASNWLNYAYGRTLGTGDECTEAAVKVAFQQSGFNVKQLLLALTQTDEFLYYPGSP